MKLETVGRGLVGAALFACVFASDAAASPWTLPDDQLALSMDYDFQYASNEYLPDGTFQGFPLDGRFISNTLRLGARYGFTERFEGGIALNVKQVTYLADPVIVALPEDPATLQQSRESVKNFSTSDVGAGDLFLSGRYNFLKTGSLRLTTETQVKLPTGYSGPQETFAGSVATGELQDDVALGDSQTDIQQSLLLGAYVPATRTFFRAGAGFRLRMGDPGHQITTDAKLGQFLGDRLVAFAGAMFDYTVIEGNIIGKSFTTTDPDASAIDFDPATVTPVDLRLDKDYLQVQGGLLFIVNDATEMQFTYSYIPWGANTSAIHAVSAGVSVQIPELTAE